MKKTGFLLHFNIFFLIEMVFLSLILMPKLFVLVFSSGGMAVLWAVFPGIVFIL